MNIANRRAIGDGVTGTDEHTAAVAALHLLKHSPNEDTF